MKLNTVLLFTAILTLFGGIVIILFPEFLMSFFTGRPMADQAPILYIQWFGALHLSLSVLSWRARKLRDVEARRTVLIAMLVYCIGGVSITGRFQFTGLLNAWGWFLPAHQAVLGLCYAYYLFVRKDLIPLDDGAGGSQGNEAPTSAHYLVDFTLGQKYFDAPEQERKALTEQEIEYGKQLFKAGIWKHAYTTPGEIKTESWAIYQAAGRAELERYLAEYPMDKRGMYTRRVHEVNIVDPPWIVGLLFQVLRAFGYAKNWTPFATPQLAPHH